MKVSANVKIAMQSFEILVWWGKCPNAPSDCAPALFDTAVKSLNCFMLSATARMNWACLMIGPQPSRNCTSWNDIASSASWAKIECSPGETIRLSIVVVQTVRFWVFDSVVFRFCSVSDKFSNRWRYLQWLKNLSDDLKRHLWAITITPQQSASTFKIPLVRTNASRERGFNLTEYTILHNRISLL